MQTSRSKPCPCPSFKLREVASMYFTMIAVFLVILVVALQGSAPRGSDFPYKVPLDPQGLLELSWNVSYPEQVVNFQLLLRDLRFGLLFGMSDRGEFENADLAVLWSDGHNSYFGDAWSDAKGQLHMDSQQDYQLLGARRAPEGLYLLFRRAFSTCDPKDYLIEDGTVHLIYGILEKPVHSLHAINISAIYRGLQRVQLLKPNITVPELPSDMKTMEITAPNIVIPSQETTYWCYMTELPADFPKHHIIMRTQNQKFLSRRWQGRHDSSGIRLYYTATLRRYDAGIMELGLVYTPVMAIPPGEDAFILTGYCTDKCTQLVSAHPLCPSFTSEKRGCKWFFPGPRQQ
ncbi:dopamine beta-hydroxylase [Limosa lapponica baueri]|uniref:Dopamine beta-hydroxylase n=1 Tax=Limosa lapponica baueri TaxID=1758121 RepID=A0A2I0TC92_LIMLA|nr:dopamine beta-hydroxylase [Limosa lapponica baueri]